MPQVDLESLVSVCAGGSCDRKIACETLADGDHPPEQPPYQSEVPPDFPPDSFWLSKDAELDWFDRNAFFERKESQKGNSNSTNLNPNINPHSSSNSQRFSSSLKSKASIIGLPKPQKSCFVDPKNRRHCKSKTANTRLFPKRSRSTGKSDAPMVEPSSPKVSCMGRVRSKKDRSRRLKNLKQSFEQEPRTEKQAAKHRTSFFASFRAIFRHGRRKAAARGSAAPCADSSARRNATVQTHDIRDRLPPGVEPSVESPPRKSFSGKARPSGGSKLETEPVGLGGMKRFASGRRSESWVGGDVA